MPDPTQPTVTRYEIAAESAWITLSSPETRNALSAALMDELAGHLRRAHADPSVRSIVLTGEGPAFCAGADLKSRGLAGTRYQTRTTLPEILTLIRDGDKPVVAAVNGAAFGGGLGLVAAADIAIGAAGAKMAFSEVRVGVIPAIISVVVIPKIGTHRAMRLFLTGKRFTAEDAVGYGLLHEVVPSSELQATVRAELDAIHLGGPIAVREAKRLVRTVAALDEEEAFRYAAEKSLTLFESDEAAEGMAAFREKRAPGWTTST